MSHWEGVVAGKAGDWRQRKHPNSTTCVPPPFQPSGLHSLWMSWWSTARCAHESVNMVEQSSDSSGIWILSRIIFNPPNFILINIVTMIHDNTMIMITTLKISWWDDDCQRSQCLPLLGEWSFTTFPSRHPSTHSAPTFTLNQSLHTESNDTIHFSHIVHIGARWYTDRNINQMKRERSCGEWGGWAWNTASPTFTNTFANADK